MPLLTVVIVSYNSSAVIDECLKPLLDDDRCRAIIVDNASTDGSASILQDTFRHAQVIALGQNIGYGRAANVALGKVETPYALLLNPDLIASYETVERLLEHAIASSDDVAIWGPATSHGEVENCSPQQVDWISGCAMLFKMELLREVGLFDENIFLFFEETDLCYRTIQAGKKILQCRDVYFEHLVGKATPPDTALDYMKNWHYGWSRGYYYDKHNQGSGKKDPRRRARKYFFKSLVSSSSAKRSRYRANADGLNAFIRGGKAFRENGSPSAMP